ADRHIGTAPKNMDRELAVSMEKFKKAGTRRHEHFVRVNRIPRTHDEPPRIGILLERLDEIRNLVHRLLTAAIERAPLLPVNRAEVAGLDPERCANFRRRPDIPKVHAVLIEVLDVRAPRQKPKQFVNHRLPRTLHTARRDEWKPIVEIEPHLVAANRDIPN